MISIGGLGFAFEQETAVSITEPLVSPYSLDLTRELVIFGAGTATWAIGAIAISGIDPLTDEEIFALDPEDVNKFDRPAILLFRTHLDRGLHDIFAAKVFSDYLSSKTAKALIWTAAAVYPAAVGYLRRDSAHHFRTDVITGYIVGALIGCGIPLLHKTIYKDLSVHPVISPNQVSLALRYTPIFAQASRTMRRSITLVRVGPVIRRSPSG